MRRPYWRWKAPNGSAGQREQSPQAAAEAAIRVALSARPDMRLDRDTKDKLWRSLKAKGWAVEEIEL